MYNYFSEIINFFLNESLLDKAFETAKDEQLIIDKNFNSSGDLINILQYIIKLISKLGIAIGVSLFIFGGIRMLLTIGDENKMKKTRDDLILSALGLLITLGSLGILYLLQSIPRGISM